MRPARRHGSGLKGRLVPGTQFVFGYGSLAALTGPPPTRELDPRGFVTDLPGFSRAWGVAMDNRRDLPGYKYYRRPDGYRPAVHVAFLDLVERPAAADPGAGANGVCFPVDEHLLETLDARERNYRRIDVSERVAAGGARVWTYIGSTAGRERLAAGVRIGTAVIDAGYLRLVKQGFSALGGADQRAARDSLRPGDLPVVELLRHELP